MSKALPNFLCVGAQKAGTSTLYQLLKQHPDIYMSNTKEVHFFDRDENYKKGLGYYSSFFVDGYSDQKLIGEVTPSYMQFAGIAKKIRENLGEIKILAILRHPVKRAYSQYNFHRMLGHESGELSFEERLEEEVPDHAINSRRTWYDPAFYLSKSLYHDQVKRYIDVFGKENVHVLFFEEIISGDKSSLDRMCNFLGVSEFEFHKDHSNPTILNYNSYWMNQIKKLNKFLFSESRSPLLTKLKGKVKKQVFKRPEKLDPSTATFLLNKYFKEEVAKLEQLLGKDLSFWK